MDKKGYVISEYRVGKIMEKYGLVSKYNLYRKANPNRGVNQSPEENKLDRNFGEKSHYEAVVSDLTYVKVREKWCYICLIIELSKREIIGFSAGENKDAKLVNEAILSSKCDLRKIGIFHTDRGTEFGNELIDETLAAFGIERSLSRKGKPIDNAVAESTYDILKVEFVFGRKFADIFDLKKQLSDWVWWYNNKRIHSALGYISPAEAKAKGVSVPCGKRYFFDKEAKKWAIKQAG